MGGGAASDLRWGSERHRWPRRIFVWGFGRGLRKIEVGVLDDRSAASSLGIRAENWERESHRLGFLDDRSAASSSGTAPPPRAQELWLRTGRERAIDWGFWMTAPPPRFQEIGLRTGRERVIDRFFS
ncbi:uncharacterized protein A4U43_C04F28300 [Asparagus officinalis]|uniref:Uncharacterized protein n=1 Tax=Asparagus officinalis TaxID=4686 RepID=A0A5P1F8X3_ASPOF|nr:uncharacterized protein A4U43_C04F28300 [Asparagus officinalis]